MKRSGKETNAFNRATQNTQDAWLKMMADLLRLSITGFAHEHLFRIHGARQAAVPEAAGLPGQTARGTQGAAE